MRLREFFHECDNSNYDDDELEKFKLRKKSHFMPSRGRDAWLDMYIELVKNDIVASLNKRGKMNISPSESSALHSLLNNADIIIRPADKGSGVVVLNKAEYIDKLHQEMVSSNSYVEVEKDVTRIATQQVKKVVNKMYNEGSITGDLKQYMLPKYPEPGKLKGNPKLHKQSVPLRTIVSGVNTPTEKMAEVAETELKEFVEKSPSYIKDTTDFISKLKEIQSPVPDNAILFCFDVCKLYPSVPRKEGLEACKKALESRTAPLLGVQETLTIIETVLDYNVFSLGDKYYRQVDGIAIGSRLGRNFACAYMRMWDEQLMKYHRRPYFYKRYIDDGFGIWIGDLASLQEFTNYANSIHDNIKIELRWSSESIEFLDTRVVLREGCVYTDLYIKPTDKMLYLQESSCHPPHTKKSLAYGLGVRIKRICEREEDYVRHRGLLKQQLRKRGYSGKTIEQQLRKVDDQDRHTLLLKKEKRKKIDRVPLVLTFSKILPDIRAIFKKHQTTLYMSDRMRQVFPEPPLLAYRRDRNLCDVLVHTKTNRALSCKRETCGCEICLQISTSEVSNTSKDNSYLPVPGVDCSVRNIVYVIMCKRCGETVYVGETERTLKERMKEHKRDIRMQVDKPINRHFHNHVEGDLRVAVLKKLYGDSRSCRLSWEDHWIRLLKTGVPYGCNVKVSMRK